MEPHWTLGASWSMETPKLVIICPKDHLPLIPNLPAAACNSPCCCGSKGFGMFSALWAWEATQKSSQVAHCRHCPIAFPKLLWGLPAKRTPAPACLVTCPVEQWVPLCEAATHLFSLVKQVNVFMAGAKFHLQMCAQCPHRRWQLHLRGGAGPLWLTELVSSHTCVLHAQAKMM